ncbi:hypothetical protein FQA39_LY18662 [Lamprigera yunnana]|nr:hypothetical protein FQA39_LY18662 [Lamprigera yunnana]
MEISAKRKREKVDSLQHKVACPEYNEELPQSYYHAHLRINRHKANACRFLENVNSKAISCIQLAKEQMIKYSDPKYNINDFKTGDCKTMLLNQTIYYLNKSKSKWISTFDTIWKPKQIGSKTLTFEIFEEKKILRNEDMSGNEVYLGWESV